MELKQLVFPLDKSCYQQLVKKPKAFMTENPLMRLQHLAAVRHPLKRSKNWKEVSTSVQECSLDVDETLRHWHGWKPPSPFHLTSNASERSQNRGNCGRRSDMGPTVSPQVSGSTVFVFLGASATSKKCKRRHLRGRRVWGRGERVRDRLPAPPGSLKHSNSGAQLP